MTPADAHLLVMDAHQTFVYVRDHFAWLVIAFIGLAMLLRDERR